MQPVYCSPHYMYMEEEKESEVKNDSFPLTLICVCVCVKERERENVMKLFCKYEIVKTHFDVRVFLTALQCKSCNTRFEPSG